jgi:hypothetical protein
MSIIGLFTFLKILFNEVHVLYKLRLSDITTNFRIVAINNS